MISVWYVENNRNVVVCVCLFGILAPDRGVTAYLGFLHLSRSCAIRDPKLSSISFHLSICFSLGRAPPCHCRHVVATADHVDILVYVVLGPSRRMDHPSFLQKTWPMVQWDIEFYSGFLGSHRHRLGVNAYLLNAVLGSRHVFLSHCWVYIGLLAETGPWTSPKPVTLQRTSYCSSYCKSSLRRHHF
ncbi:hypothetical protein B0H12DRAFT_191350 [Mycena haematopus]|nr:hypothetical protein B0H12DRAFT_191350 [Mycena haematopus]